MPKSYIKPDNACQEEILSNHITLGSWAKVAAAIRKRIALLENVAQAFERYRDEGEPFPGDQRVSRGRVKKSRAA